MMHSVSEKILFQLSDAGMNFTATIPCDIVVSNPPYISKTEYVKLAPEIQNYEPRIALTDGADGLTYYRQFSSMGKNLIEPDGIMILEHAYDQQSAVKKIFLDAGWNIVEGFNDYSGQPRGVVVQ
jgi:release factor glutamine methyltransferase